MSKILVIDDNKDSLISIREVLKILDSSYQVIVVQNGVEISGEKNKGITVKVNISLKNK